LQNSLHHGMTLYSTLKLGSLNFKLGKSKFYRTILNKYIIKCSRVIQNVGQH